MRKTITNLFVLAIALFAVQGTMAQTSEEVFFEEKFDAVTPVPIVTLGDTRRFSRGSVILL